MNDSARPAGVGWENADGQPQSLYVITLMSATTPMPLKAPKVPELAGLAVFRSRKLEDGRERFRLHIGYFASAAEAERLLPVVREHFPAAIVGTAPQANLGSLEDTAVARFSILKPIEAAPAAEQAAPEPPRPAAPPVLSNEEAAAVLDASTPSPKVVPITSAPSVAARAAAPAPAPVPEPAAEEKVVQKRAPQKYAVQLVWSKTAIDLGQLPALAIFEGYLIYAVETQVVGRRMFGVRLGFYADALSARLVAQYIRSEFKNVAVVPVSDREVARASGATIRLAAVKAARGGARPRWPAAAVAVDYVAAATSL